MSYILASGSEGGRAAESDGGGTDVAAGSIHPQPGQTGAVSGEQSPHLWTQVEMVGEVILDAPGQGYCNDRY